MLEFCIINLDGITKNGRNNFYFKDVGIRI